MPKIVAVRGDQARAGNTQLLKELNEERAAALHRISSTLESLIRQLHASRERVRHASGPIASVRSRRGATCGRAQSGTAGISKCSAKRSGCAGTTCSTSSIKVPALE